MNNSRRVFDELVSLEAWHSAFSAIDRRASVHADITFHHARLGQEASSPVRFRARLACAEVTLIVPDHEPLRVVQSTVARDDARSASKLVERSRHSTERGSTLGMAGSVSQSQVGFRAAGQLDQKISTQIEQTQETNLRMILSTQNRSPDGHYRWRLQPGMGKFLDGKVWDASREPRAIIEDTRTDDRHLGGSCRIEVRCKHEDIVIEDISIKDKSLLRTIVSQRTFLNRMAAAESYIRDRIFTLGLETKDYDDLFGDICLGEALVEPLVE